MGGPFKLGVVQNRLVLVNFDTSNHADLENVWRFDPPTKNQRKQNPTTTGDVAFLQIPPNKSVKSWAHPLRKNPKGSIDAFLSLLWPHLLPGALVLHLGKQILSIPVLETNSCYFTPWKIGGKGRGFPFLFLFFENPPYFQVAKLLVSGSKNQQKLFGVGRGFVEKAGILDTLILGGWNFRVSKHVNFLWKKVRGMDFLQWQKMDLSKSAGVCGWDFHSMIAPPGFTNGEGRLEGDSCKCTYCFHIYKESV